MPTYQTTACSIQSCQQAHPRALCSARHIELLICASLLVMLGRYAAPAIETMPVNHMHQNESMSRGPMRIPKVTTKVVPGMLKSQAF